MGKFLRQMDSPIIFLFLAPNAKNLRSFPASNEKNLKNDKKNVCICKKMGYNKVESL